MKPARNSGNEVARIESREIGGVAGKFGLPNGLLTGSTLGSSSNTISYNSFAEPSAYEATINSGIVFRQQYTRDDLGRE